MILQVIQTVEWIHRMYVTCELMGQASRDDTRTELSGPGQPGLADEDG